MKQWPPRQAMRERLIIQGGDPDIVKVLIRAHTSFGIDAVNQRLNQFVDLLNHDGLLLAVEQGQYMTVVTYLGAVKPNIVKPLRLMLVPMSNAQWN